MNRALMVTAAMMAAGAVAVTSSDGAGVRVGVREAQASTADVCRFRASGSMVYDGVSSYSLEFWWRRDTNAVLNSGGRTTKWTNSFGRLVAAPYAANPGAVTGSDGITGASSVAAAFTLLLDTGVIGLPIVLTGNLVNGGYHTSHVLAGHYYGSSQVWIAANGEVTCGFSL